MMNGMPPILDAIDEKAPVCPHVHAVVDDGRACKPSWEEAALVDPLLQLGDSRERTLVQAIIKTAYDLAGHLDRAVRARSAVLAGQELKQARQLVDINFRLALSLQRHRYGNIKQIKILPVEGAAVGLGARVEACRRPAPASPDGRLVERLEDMEAIFSDAAERLARKARHVTATIGDEVARQRALSAEEAVPSPKEAAHWITLSIRAAGIAATILEQVIKLEQRDRGVVIVEETSRSWRKSEITTAPVGRGARVTRLASVADGNNGHLSASGRRTP